MGSVKIFGTSDKLLGLANDETSNIILRTKISDAAEMMDAQGIKYESLDYVYDNAEDFDALDVLLAEEVKKKAESKDLIYIVPGSGVTGDGSVREILNICDDVTIVAGNAPEYEMLALLGNADTSSGYAVIPAACLEIGMFSPRLPLIVTALDNGYLLSDIKIMLSDEYGDEHKIYIGSEGEYKKTALYEADRVIDVSHKTMMYVPPKLKTSRYDMFELEGVFKKLRAPDGCPWDREQTHESLKRYLLEEAAEVLDAIDSKDMYELMDELGDVLLQILFHATIASERGDFDMRDTIDNLARKLIRRHPHVFADAQAEDPEAVLKQWDEIKHHEKEDKSVQGKLNGVPKAMPALMRAQKVIKRAAKTEYLDENMRNIELVLKCLLENLEKFDIKSENIEQLLGSILFSIANISMLLDIESELSLTAQTKEFIQGIAEKEAKNEGFKA